MASTFWTAPTKNFTSTTLNGAINSSADTITLNSVTGVQAPGYIVIDRENSAGTATPDAREVISYTGVSGYDLTGCSRGADGSTARSHSDGAIVEFVPTVGMWNSLTTIVASGFTGEGYLKAIASPVTIARLHMVTHLTTSGASVTATDLKVTQFVSVSGASVVGLTKIRPVFSVIAPISGATTGVGTVILPEDGTWNYFSACVVEQVSTASLNLDVNLNGTSIFDTVGRPQVPAGGTYVSTASIKTKTFTRGQVLSMDIDAFSSSDGYSKGVTLVGVSL